jgi:putative heme iron utilization protein
LSNAERLAAVRALLESQREGVLATLSKRHGGYPFGSLTPYALTSEGDPILLLSALAEHTRNVLADPRASLFVQRGDVEDSQAEARVTLLGTANLSPEPEHRTRYVARHPRGEEYLSLGDFATYVLRVEHIRFVAGFGEMGWLSAPFD